MWIDQVLTGGQVMHIYISTLGLIGSDYGLLLVHNSDVIMSMMVSQIAGILIVCSVVC